MDSKQTKSLVDRAVEQLEGALKAGRSDALVRFLEAAAQFHDYSWGNILLILTQRPSATRVAGFHTWRKLGRFVKRGEKGIAIIAPVVYKRDPADGSDDKGIRGFRAVYVFDVQQTDGQPLPEISEATGDPGACFDRLSALVATKGIALEYLPDLGGALGSSSNGTIRVKTDLPPAAKFSVIVHELAHEMLHWGDAERPADKSTRELEAEAVAFICGHAVGLEALSASADYIQLYRGNAESLSASLDRITRAATEILKAIQPPA